MRKFTRDTRLHAMPFPDNCKEMFSVLPACSEGSVADTLHAGDITLQVSPRPPIKRVALDCLESAAMADLYSALYPDQDIHCPRLCDSYSKVLLNGVMCRTTQTVGVIVCCPDGESRPAKVQRFIRHDVIFKNSNDGKRRRRTDDVAEVEWFNSHPERHSRYPAPLEVWSTDTSYRAYVFLQISRPSAY
ncbi:uncharacterized protein LOC116609242 [Nematostella vectensis]|uniref:uncharacterized protein LOC116609242 n=1 Tax=Nematostella vectensis TaxID=45351 RepID=UPI00207794E1|nr:uncharacterized protein LOC116609242 [Nematostella vectensis]